MSIEVLNLSSSNQISAEAAFIDIASERFDDARAATDGVDVAQAETSGFDSGTPPGRDAFVTSAVPSQTQLEPNERNIVTLPIGIQLDNLEFVVDGDNLVLVLADGTEIVVVGGAKNIPTFLIGDVELPQLALFAALEGSNINVAAGADGTFSAEVRPSSSSGRFDDPRTSGDVEEFSFFGLLDDSDPIPTISVQTAADDTVIETVSSAPAVPLTTAEDVSLTISIADLVASGSVANTGTLSVLGVVSNTANGGQVSLVGGVIIYTPPANFNGTDVFTYSFATASGTSTATATINVTPVNDAPTAIALSANTVLENAVGAVIGNLTTTDADAGDRHTYTVNDARFIVENGQLRLAAGQSLNFETTDTVEVTVTATDAGGLQTQQQFKINVMPVNEAPTGIVLSANTVLENAVGAVIGNVTTTDPDVGDRHSYTVDDDRFIVENGQLKLAAGRSLDFETADTVKVTVTATDAGGLKTEQQFTITVTNVNERPVITSGLTASVDENASVSTVVYTVTTTDLDGPSITYRLEGADAGIFNIDENGRVTFRNSPNFEQQADSNRDNIYNIKVIASDGELRDEKDVAITVRDVQEQVSVTSITFDKQVLKVGEAAIVTIVFSDRVTGFSKGNLAVDHGTFSDPFSLDGNKTWTAVFTPDANVEDTSNIVRVNGLYRDVDGNPGLEATSGNFIIDTRRPTAAIAFDENLLYGGESTKVTITFSEPVTDFTNDDLTTRFGTLTPVSSSDGGRTWTTTFTAMPPIQGQTISVAGTIITLDNEGVFDLAGNAGQGLTRGTGTIHLTPPDREPPRVLGTSYADDKLAGGESTLVTITFNERVTGLELEDFTVQNGSLSNLSTSDNGQTWTATLTPANNIEAVGNTITLNQAGLQDAAGNLASGSIILPGTFDVDTRGPTATILVEPFSGGTYASAVTITFSESVMDLPVAALSTGQSWLNNSQIVSNDGGKTWTALLGHPIPVEAAGSVITLDNSLVRDLSGNAGTGTTISNAFNIDTKRPTATIDIADQELTAGETTLVTITFTEPVTGLDIGDFRVGNGSLSNLAPSDGGRIWTATLTPTANTNSPTNVIELNYLGYTDLAGNNGGYTAFSRNYTVNTVSRAPTDIIWNAVDPGSGLPSTGSTIANLTTVDPDNTGPYTYRLVSNTTDFSVSSSGVVTSNINFANGANYRLDIEVRDALGETFTEKFVIVTGIDGDETNIVGIGMTAIIYGANGNDTLDSRDITDDVLIGQDGNDNLIAGAGNDTLYGGAGADSLSGGNDNDTLYGEDGDTSLNGGNGTDTLIIDRDFIASSDLQVSSIEKIEMTGAARTLNLSNQAGEGFSVDIFADFNGEPKSYNVTFCANNGVKDEIIFRHNDVEWMINTVVTVSNFETANDKVRIVLDGQASTGGFAEATGDETNLQSLANNGVIQILDNRTTGSLAADAGGGTVHTLIANAIGALNAGRYTVIVYSDTTGSANAGIYSLQLEVGQSSVTIFNSSIEHVMTINNVGYGNLGSGNFAGVTDPIILDLNQNGFAFSSIDSGVSFDINADGNADQIAWTSNDGILAYDVDGNGTIDNGSEIFTPDFNGGKFASGVAALASLDSNGDGKIDAGDAAFKDLKIWIDADNDGISDEGELSGLTDNGVTSISLTTDQSGGSEDGQVIFAEGEFTFADGSTGNFVEVGFDTIFGSESEGVTLHGGMGKVVMTGTAGADTFVFDETALGGLDVADVITDFSSEEGDVLDVTALLDSLLGEQPDAPIDTLLRATLDGAGNTTVSVQAEPGIWKDVVELQNHDTAIKVLFEDKHTTFTPHD